MVRASLSSSSGRCRVIWIPKSSASSSEKKRIVYSDMVGRYYLEHYISRSMVYGSSVGLAKLSQLSNGGLRAYRTECCKRCYHVKSSQFARKAFSWLNMGLILVGINNINEIM